MLSKAEILYLPGQKTIIKSYERVLKILIKKNDRGYANRNSLVI